MSRTLNLLLILLVLVCGVSLWLAQGRPLPEFLSGIEKRPVPGVPADLESHVLSVHLRILNGTEEPGLAGEVALLVTRLGCVVEGIGNADHWSGTESVLINRRLPNAEANSLAIQLGGLPVLREWDGRTTEDAVLILGNDHQEISVALRKRTH